MDEPEAAPRVPIPVPMICTTQTQASPPIEMWQGYIGPLYKAACLTCELIAMGPPRAWAYHSHECGKLARN